MLKLVDLDDDVLILIATTRSDPWGDDSPYQEATRRASVLSLCLTCPRLWRALRHLLRSRLSLIAGSHADDALSVVERYGYGHQVRSLTFACAPWRCPRTRVDPGGPLEVDCSCPTTLVTAFALCQELQSLSLRALSLVDDRISQLISYGIVCGVLPRLQQLEVQPLPDAPFQLVSLLFALPSLRTLTLGGDFATVSHDEGPPPPFRLRSLRLRQVTKLRPDLVDWIVRRPDGHVLDDLQISSGSGRTPFDLLLKDRPTCRSVHRRFTERLSWTGEGEAVEGADDGEHLRSLRLDYRGQTAFDPSVLATHPDPFFRHYVNLDSVRVDLPPMPSEGAVDCAVGFLATHVLDAPVFQKVSQLVITSPSPFAGLSPMLDRICRLRQVHLVTVQIPDDRLDTYRAEATAARERELERLREFRARYRYGGRVGGKGNEVKWELLPRSTTETEARLRHRGGQKGLRWTRTMMEGGSSWKVKLQRVLTT